MRTRENARVDPDPEPERVSGPRGGRVPTQAAARVNASLSLSVNNERKLTWPTRTDFRHFGTTRTRS